MTCGECAWFRRKGKTRYGTCKGGPPVVVEGWGQGRGDGNPWGIWPTVHEDEEHCGAFRLPADYKFEQQNNEPMRFGGDDGSV